AEAGYVFAIDGETLGHAVVALGGGRRLEADKVDPRVGLTDVLPLGAAVVPGHPLAMVHAATEDAAEVAVASVTKAITVERRRPSIPDLIHRRIT
ncbi:MAG: thymidine phosphorylase, partial [Shimia sp.]